MVSMCSVPEDGAEVQRQLPEKGPTLSPRPTPLGSAVLGGPPSVHGSGRPPQARWLPRLGLTLGFLIKASPYWKVCNSPSGAAQVETNLSASLKFMILNKISAVISRQLAGMGHMLSGLRGPSVGCWLPLVA